MIYEKVLALCEERKIKVARLEKEVGLGNGTVRGWKNSIPGVTTLKKVSDYFGVGIEELLREDNDNDASFDDEAKDPPSSLVIYQEIGPISHLLKLLLFDLFLLFCGVGQFLFDHVLFLLEFLGFAFLAFCHGLNPFLSVHFVSCC